MWLDWLSKCSSPLYASQDQTGYMIGCRPRQHVEGGVTAVHQGGSAFHSFWRMQARLHFALLVPVLPGDTTTTTITTTLRAAVLEAADAGLSDNTCSLHRRLAHSRSTTDSLWLT